MRFLRIGLVAATAAAGAAFGQTRPAEPATRPSDLVGAFKTLKPLPKVHYSWPLPRELLGDPNDPRFYEFVRITHAASLSGYGVTRQELEAALLVCKYVNASKPAIAATLAVNYSPWHHGFPTKAPPTDFGRNHTAELARMRERLQTIAGWVERANTRYDAQVRVSAVLLDSERFIVKRGDADPEWNKAITRKLREAYELAAQAFPEARIEWFAHGIEHSWEGWRRTSQFTFEEPGRFFSTILYCVPNTELTYETQRRTVEFAIERGIEEVTPWVALASGYRKDAKGIPRFHWDWDYDTAATEDIGRKINRPYRADRSDPWSFGRVAVLYPSPFDSRTPAWGKHFVAYVEGGSRADRSP